MAQQTPAVPYSVTGSAAHDRIAPLLPSHWIDATATANIDTHKSKGDGQIQFLWENAPRHSTKSIRDHVKCYSHLPNGLAVLDSKWALARLLTDHHTRETSDSSFAMLETHCFQGITGFQEFVTRVGLISDDNDEVMDDSPNSYDITEFNLDVLELTQNFKEAMNRITSSKLPPSPKHLWVLKDAHSNGAGGIWILSPSNVSQFLPPSISPLQPQHHYVAQRYAWPPALYHGKKCHVRVYALLTSDGKAHVHQRAFLHVANDTFVLEEGEGIFEPTVHITNCCANSHDEEIFAGEICVRLTESSSDLSIHPFYSSICASIKALAKSAFPFLQGGEGNGGFEYLGLDFMLSYRSTSKDGLEPIAYLLEVNAPPSQDTATGLLHAEGLHNEVISDLLSLWVYPHVCGSVVRRGGWECVYQDEEYSNGYDSSLLSIPISPSKAVILNKLKWAMFERQQQLRYKQQTPEQHHHPPQSIENKELQLANKISHHARSYFPYFHPQSHAHNRNIKVPPPKIFLENAGGAQVPNSVISAMNSSLSHRHRDVLGVQSKEWARQTLLSILGAVPSTHFQMNVSQEEYIQNSDGISNFTNMQRALFLGANATLLLQKLSQKYMEFGGISDKDEIVIAQHNHDANITPWLQLAKQTGAKVKWWNCHIKPQHEMEDNASSNNSPVFSPLQDLEQVLSPNTRIFAIPHASNVLGQLLDIHQIAQKVKSISCGKARIIVDGVAAVPHQFANLEESCIDWYVVSCHKLFGPHLGALCGRLDAIQELDLSQREGQIPLIDNMKHKDLDLDVSNTAYDANDLCKWYKEMETGTINYEACAGVGLGLAEYFQALTSTPSVPKQDSHQCTSQEERIKAPQNEFKPILKSEVSKFYHNVATSESPIMEFLIQSLNNSSQVRIIQEASHDLILRRLPIISFTHKKIKSTEIVRHCANYNIVGRQGHFLSHSVLGAFGISNSTFYGPKSIEDKHSDDGVVRFSIAHYNTMNEIHRLVHILEKMDDWK